MSGHGEHKEEHSHGEHGGNEAGHSEEHGDDGHEEHHEEKHEEHSSGHEEKPRGNDEHGKETKATGHEKSGEDKVGKKKKISEYDVLILLAVAVFGRVLLKVTPLTNIPSVEPIIPIAVFAALNYGTSAGILIGLLGYPLSNAFLPEDSIGLWTFWQAVGGAVAGGVAGFAKKNDANALLWYSVLGTVLFELAVNLPDQELLVWPFSFVHIASNAVFALLLSAFLRKEK